MRGAARVVLDADDVARAGRRAHEVDEADTLPVPASDVPHGDASGVVASAGLAAGDSELADGAALEDVGGQRPLEVATAGGDGLIRFVEHGVP